MVTLTDYKDFKSSISIDGITIRIIKDPKWAEKTGNSGNCDYSNQLITIDGSMSQELQQSTLLHEIFHWICDHYEIDLSHKELTALASTLFGVLINHDLEEILRV